MNTLSDWHRTDYALSNHRLEDGTSVPMIRAAARSS